MSVLICVKSKHGCSSGMISWTFEFVKRTALSSGWAALLGPTLYPSRAQIPHWGSIIVQNGPQITLPGPIRWCIKSSQVYIYPSGAQFSALWASCVHTHLPLPILRSSPLKWSGAHSMAHLPNKRHPIANAKLL